MVDQEDKGSVKVVREPVEETGHKHLIRCRCVLPQLKRCENPPRFGFVVFSIIGNDDVVVPKFVQCPHCGVIHKVTGICESEIIQGKESMVSLLTIDDVKLGLPERLAEVLEVNGADLPTWEMTHFIYERKRWGQYVVLCTEEESGMSQGKILRILGKNLFKVDPFTRNEVM